MMDARQNRVVYHIRGLLSCGMSYAAQRLDAEGRVNCQMDPSMLP